MKDEASIKRFGLIEEEITRLGKELADLEEIWKTIQIVMPDLISKLSVL